MLPSDPNQLPNGNGPNIAVFKDLLKMLKDRDMPNKPPDGPQRASHMPNFLFPTTDHRLPPQQQSHDLRPPPPMSVQQSHDLRPPLRPPVQQSPSYNGYTHFGSGRPPLQRPPPPAVQPRSSVPQHFMTSDIQRLPSQRLQRPRFPHLSSSPLHQRQSLRSQQEPYGGPPYAVPNTPYPVALHRNKHVPPVASMLPTSLNNGLGQPVIMPSNLAPAASEHQTSNEPPPGGNPCLSDGCPLQTSGHQNNGNRLDFFLSGLKEMLERKKMGKTVESSPGNIEPLAQKSTPNMDTNSSCNDATTGNVIDSGNVIADSPIIDLNQSIVKEEVIEVDEDNEDCMLVGVDLKHRIFTLLKPLDNTVVDLVEDSDDENGRQLLVKVETQDEGSTAQPPVDDDSVDDNYVDDPLPLENTLPGEGNALDISSVQESILDPCLEDGQLMDCLPGGTGLSVNAPVDEGTEAENAPSNNILKIVSGLGEILQSISATPITNKIGPLATVKVEPGEVCDTMFNPFPGIHGVEIVLSDSDNDGELDKGKKLCSPNSRLPGVEVRIHRVSLNEETCLISSSDHRTTIPSKQKSVSTPTGIVDKNGHRGLLEEDASPNTLKVVSKRGRPKNNKPKIDESLEDDCSTPSTKTVVIVPRATTNKKGNDSSEQIVNDFSLDNVSARGQKFGHTKKTKPKIQENCSTPSTKTVAAATANKEGNDSEQIVKDFSPDKVRDRGRKRGHTKKTKPKIQENCSTPSTKTIAAAAVNKEGNDSSEQIVKDFSPDKVRGRGRKRGHTEKTTGQIAKRFKGAGRIGVNNETPKQIVDKMIEGTRPGLSGLNDPISLGVNVTQAATNNTEDSLDISDNNRSIELVRKECHMATTPDVQSGTVRTVHKSSSPGHGTSPSSTSGLMESSRSESEDSDTDTSSNESDVSNSSWEDAHVEYTCKVCSKSFGRKSHFKKHMKTHKGGSAEKVEKKITCKGCRRKFANKTCLQAHLLQRRYCFYDCTHIHWKAKTSSSTKSCPMCNKGFDRLKYLKKHAYKHLTCRLEFINLVLDKIKQHPKDVVGNAKHNDKVKDKSENESVIPDHKVLEARQIYKGNQGLPTETTAAPSITPSNVQDQANHKKSENYPCKSCQQDFQTPVLFRDHLNVNNSCKLFCLQPGNSSPVSLNYCPSCRIFMSCQSKLVNHHCEGENTVSKCPSCSKVFCTLFGLKRHLKMTTCSSSILDNGEQTKGNASPQTALKKGMENAMGNRVSVSSSSVSRVVETAGMERYECLVCQKMFHQVQGLLEHSYSHTEDGRFLCNDCSMVFSRYNSLVSHTIWHRRKQELVNEKGDESSMSSSTEKTVTQLSAGSVIKIYPCPKCPIKFKRKADLNVHWQKHKFPKNKKSLQIIKTRTKNISALPNDTLFSCSSCGQQFPTLNSRNDHLETCVGCQGKTTLGEGDSSRPVTTDDNKCIGKASMAHHSNLVKCILCPRFLLKQSFKSHFKSHVNKYSRHIKQEATMPLIAPCEVVCMICRKTMSSRRGLITHINRHRPDEIMKQTKRRVDRHTPDEIMKEGKKCSYTSGHSGVSTSIKEEAISPRQSLTIRKGMTKKIAKQTYNFSCKQCAKRFFNIPSLKFHLKNAHKHLKSDGLSSFVSNPQSGIKSLNPSSAVKRQMLSCEICQKVVQKASLPKHMQNLHGLPSALFSVRQRKSASKTSDLNLVKKELNPGLTKTAMNETENCIDISSKMSSIANKRALPRIEVDNGGMDIISSESGNRMQYATEWYHRECSICGEPLGSKVQSWRHQFKHVTPCSVVVFKLEHILREVTNDCEHPTNLHHGSLKMRDPGTYPTNSYLDTEETASAIINSCYPI